MPRFLLVEGVPGSPVAHPHSADPKRFVGMRRRRKEGELVHDEQCFRELIADHVDLRKPLARGELNLVRTIIADDRAAALALVEKDASPKTRPEPRKLAKGGND